MPLVRAICAVFLVVCSARAQEPSRFDDPFAGIARDFGGRLGVAARDLGTGETILFNADTLFPTASVIKLPILVELFYRFHDGELSPLQPVTLYDSLKKPGSGVLQYLSATRSMPLLDVATLMIVLSDNTATNYVIDQLGERHDDKLEAVNGRMRSLGIEHTKLLNKLYSFATRKSTEEALRFGIGVSTPRDMMLLLTKMARGEIISAAACDSMVTILRGQFDLEGAARWLPFNEDSTLWIANKTGSLDDRKIDVGIVGSARGRYVYAIFCDESKDLGEQTDNRTTLAVARVSRLLYDHFLRTRLR